MILVPWRCLARAISKPSIRSSGAPSSTASAAKGANIAGPLLVIAGAGSGKTNTLAHRVAHLIVNGADPGRILLLTFSRRAAAEMERRVERIVAAALGESKAGARNPISWSGTFHAVGARLLGCTPPRSGWSRPSPFTTARTPPIS